MEREAEQSKLMQKPKAKRGDVVQIRGLHADGQPYRWWNGIVEGCTPEEVAIVWPAGIRFDAPTPEGRKLMRHDCRMLFWPDRSYTLVEQYDGERLVQLAMDIATTAGIQDDACIYTDHELDVVKWSGRPAFVEDADEFEEAAVLYGYSAQFRDMCRVAVRDALVLVEGWKPRGRPAIELLDCVPVRKEDGR